MKTPEQIAEEVALSIYDHDGDAAERIEHEAKVGDMDGDMILGLMAEAIEADRAQCAAALDALHAWAVSMSEFMSTDKSNDWSEELTGLVEIEREHNLVDDDNEWQETQK